MGFGTLSFEIGTFLAWDPKMVTTVPPFVWISFLGIWRFLSAWEPTTVPPFVEISFLGKWKKYWNGEASKTQFSYLPLGLWMESRDGHWIQSGLTLLASTNWPFTWIVTISLYLSFFAPTIFTKGWIRHNIWVIRRLGTLHCIALRPE